MTKIKWVEKKEEGDSSVCQRVLFAFFSQLPSMHKKDFSYLCTHL